MRWLALLLLIPVLAYPETQHNTQYKAIEALINKQCSIDLELVQNKRYTVTDEGQLKSNNISVKKCPLAVQKKYITVDITPSNGVKVDYIVVEYNPAEGVVGARSCNNVEGCSQTRFLNGTLK